MELYNYNQNGVLDYDIKEVTLDYLKKDSAVKFKLTYSSSFKTNVRENDKVYSELFLPNCKSPKDHFIILVHGLGSKENKLRNYYYFINKAIENKVSSAFINLPYHLHRTPLGEVSGEKLIHSSDTDVLKFFHQAVVDIRKLIDIILNIFPESRIFICGISLGSIVSLITMAWEQRVERGIFLLCGGNWDEIYWNSMARFILRGNYVEKKKITREKSKKIYLNLPKFIDKYKEIKPANIDLELKLYPELKKLNPENCFFYDTLTFAHKINPNNVVMINSKYDFFFTKESTIQLWEELGKPEIHWLKSLHTTRVFKSKKVLEIINDFLF